MNKQEALNKIWEYAQKMEKPAIAEEGCCKYRSPNGPCLIGILVSDVEASEADSMEMPADLAIKHNLFKNLSFLDANFYEKIQLAHDNAVNEEERTLDKEAMLESIREVANEYGLKL